MSTTAHGDPAATSPTRAGVLLFEVRIVPGGAEATMAVRPDPPGSAPPEARAAADQAMAALRRSGVVHGIDEDAVREAVEAADGVARAVARATPPEPPVDGELELLFADDVARDPFHTVRAGTLLARKTPPRAGVDGVAVTGSPLLAPRPRDPAVSAGAGAVAGEERPGGAIEIHAEIEGRPRLRGSAVAVEDTVTVPGIGVGAGEVRVHGSLVVAGDVVEGSRVTTSARLHVTGIVDHARLESVAGITVGGACMGSTLRAGALQGVYARLLSALGSADEDATALCNMTAQVVQQAANAGRRVPPGRALVALLDSRFPDLGAAFESAVKIARASSVVLPPEVVSAIVDAAQTVEQARAADGVPPARMARVGAAIGAAMREMRHAAGEPADIAASYLQACRVEASGGLTLTGVGTYNTDVVVGGDLRADASGATVRGGELHVGGRVSVRELGAPGGARVLVVLEGRDGPHDRLRAGVAHPGVEVLCGGRRVVIDAKTLNLTVGFDEENGVVRSGVLAD
jgi:hypothetical protein